MSGHNQTFYKLKAKQFKNKEEVLEWADNQSEIQEKKEHELRERICWLEEQLRQAREQPKTDADYAEAKLSTANGKISNLKEELKTRDAEIARLKNCNEGLEPTTSVNLEERKDCTLYWGVNDGHLTIWRFPYELMEASMEEGEEEPDLGYIYGHKRALGEEWGSLSSAIVRTITQEMLDAEDFDN
jgi:predicted nuclease with TOPRIM domain